MKEKPKFTFALQVIVMIVIITLKKCSEWKHPDEETVFFYFPKAKFLENM